RGGCVPLGAFSSASAGAGPCSLWARVFSTALSRWPISAENARSTTAGASFMRSGACGRGGSWSPYLLVLALPCALAASPGVKHASGRCRVAPAFILAQGMVCAAARVRGADGGWPPGGQVRATAPVCHRTGRPPCPVRPAGGSSTMRSMPVPTRRVLLAKPRGYCAGVDRAVQTVEVALERYGPPIYVRKQIVHNKHVVAALEQRGAVFVEETEDIPEGGVVVFSAHGVAPQVRADA